MNNTMFDSEWLVEEPALKYEMSEFPFQNETYQIIGLCMEVHKILGTGFSEIVYKDALEFEFKQRNILYEREKQLKIHYKDIVLDHSFSADFFVFDKIILEVKAKRGIIDEHIEQTLNYLAAAEKPVALVINFGENSLKYKRVALTR